VTAIGLVIRLLLGGIVTRIYDSRGYHRILLFPSRSCLVTLSKVEAAERDSTAAKASRICDIG
jgi:hypothetical protein